MTPLMRPGALDIVCHIVGSVWALGLIVVSTWRRSAVVEIAIPRVTTEESF